MTEEIDGEDLRSAVDGFVRAFEEGCPFEEDRALAIELGAEAGPALEALAFALDAGGEGDPNRIVHHEGLAMVTLLGRRAGELGVTPTAASNIVAAIGRGLARAGRTLPAALVAPLVAVCFEGYVAARDDAREVAGAAAAVRNAPVVRVVPRALLLVLRGEYEPEVLQEIVDAFGRRMLNADAAAVVVDMTGLVGPNAERALEVFAAHATARMLGATCIFVGAGDDWITAAREGRVDIELLNFSEDLESALRRALPLCGYKLETTSWLPGPLRRVLKRT